MLILTDNLKGNTLRERVEEILESQEFDSADLDTFTRDFTNAWINYLLLSEEEYETQISMTDDVYNWIADELLDRGTSGELAYDLAGMIMDDASNFMYSEHKRRLQDLIGVDGVVV